MPHDCPVCGQRIATLPVTIYRERGMAISGGRFVLLTGSECEVMTALAQAFPRVVGKEALMTSLYGLRPDCEPEIKIIDAFICKLRKKLRVIGVEIDTAWGTGYALRVAERPVIIAEAAA